MIDGLAEGLLEIVPRAIGWAVLKVVTLGRYRGFQKEDLLLEGGVGLLAIAGATWLAYRLLAGR
jgi:hypothetical protein